jgi:proteasome assembly chaperone (PAC2) family protein
MESLEALEIPKLNNATMLLALTGWMDGGAVSTGTVKMLMSGREVKEIARITADPFYIYNFPGSMEIAALFRPTVKVKGGTIRDLDMPTNTFYCDQAANLVFFIGKEPNLRWQQFASCIFEVAKQAGVCRIIFMGSFGGTVPHTREPRMFGSISHRTLRQQLQVYAIKPSDYSGPAGFSSLLLAQAAGHDLEMLSLVAEIPGYLDGVNPLSIETVSRRLAKILNVSVDLAAMRGASNRWEIEVSEAVQKDEDLAATVKKLEEQYDNELIKEQEEP